MERKAFTLLFEAENSWWYKGRGLVVSKVLKRFFTPTSGKILDFGSGFGGMFQILSCFGKVEAFEPDKEAHRIAKRYGYLKMYPLGEEALNRKKQYSLVALFDVLEHIEDDEVFLIKVRESLCTDGKIVVTVPAYQWLWSSHDVEHHHFRRYLKKDLIYKLKKVGFSIEYASYWNMILFFPAAIVRVLGFSGKSSLKMSSLLNRIFYIFVYLESLLIQLISLPFGTGIIIFANKKVKL